MRIKKKIYLLCMILCMIILTLSGIIINENYHMKMLEKEVENCLKLEKNINIALSTYMIYYWENVLSRGYFLKKNSTRIKENLQELVENFVSKLSDKDIFFEVLDMEKNIIVSTHDYNWNVKRDEIDAVVEGNRNYVLRQIGGKHFIFVTNMVRSGIGQDYIIACIKDVSYLFQLRKEQFIFFLKIEVVALIALMIAVNFISRYITRPLEMLTETSQKIASGNYYERVNISSSDEIGILAKQFDCMASDIESKIKELEKQTEAKQRFIDNLTHELKTPLTSIIGYADLLRKNQYNKELYDKGLNHIYYEGKRINELISKMINVILLRNIEICLKEENIKELFNEVIDVMKIKLSAKEIKLQTIGPDIFIEMDRNLIKSVLINLLDNAYKASENGQTITLGSEIKAGNKCIYIKDQGKGMSREELERIKEPFYKVDKSRNKKDGGIGLGLSICDQIVKLHDGILNISSEKGKGTVVEIIFITTDGF